MRQPISRPPDLKHYHSANIVRAGTYPPAVVVCIRKTFVGLN